MPLYLPINRSLVRITGADLRADWNTRQESNLRALGSKPNGDAGNPRLVYLDQAAGIGPAWAAFLSAAGMPATHT